MKSEKIVAGNSMNITEDKMKSKVEYINELLIIDILCYLRAQSKYDEMAKALFGDLLDEVTVSFKEND